MICSILLLCYIIFIIITINTIQVIDDILDEIAIKDVKFGLINSINNYHSIFKRRRSN